MELKSVADRAACVGIAAQHPVISGAEGSTSLKLTGRILADKANRTPGVVATVEDALRAF